MNRLSRQIDLTVSSTSLRTFRAGFALLCLFEFLLRIIYSAQFNELSPYTLVKEYLSYTNQNGWSHSLFFISQNATYEVVLLAVGALLSLGCLFRKSSALCLPILAFIWLNAAYRYPFLSHGGDVIVFFTLIALSIISFQEFKGLRKTQYLLFIQFGLIMFFAGINKLTDVWFGGSAVELSFMYDSFSSSRSVPAALLPLLRVASIAIPFLEIILPFLIIFKKTRKFASVLILGFSLVLFSFFSSGILVVSIALYGVLFWPTASRSQPELSSSFKSSAIQKIAISIYIFICTGSSILNLRIFDSVRSEPASFLTQLEDRYFLEQNWSFMSTPVNNYLVVNMRPAEEAAPKRAYKVKFWIQDWSESKIANFLLIHRRAIFFKHLFWNKRPHLEKIFANAYCNKEGIINQTLEFNLSVGESKIVRQFNSACAAKEL